MNVLQPEQVYRHWSELFAQTYAGDTSASLFAFQVARRPVRARCTGPALHERLRRPLRHLEQPEDDGKPGLQQDWMDCAGSGVPMPTLPWPAQHTSLDQDTREVRHGSFLFTAHGDHVLTAFDNRSQRMVGFVRDASAWPLDHYKQAIFISLYQDLRQHGLQLIHASAVCRAGRAVLIAGGSGAGKTTAMLRLVQAGWQYLSDDATLVMRPQDGSALRAMTLLSALHVTDETVAWFPELERHASPAASARGKRLVLIDDVYPGCVALDGEVSLILAPLVTDEAHSALMPLGKAQLLSEMLPYSLDLVDTAAGSPQRQLEFLATLVERTPTYRLHLGHDWRRLPDLLSELV